jgi:CO/xanthine dehydrogenase Mo-binding subunit
VFGEDGLLQNASLLDYRMPTALDLPKINVELIEVPASDGPYGVRGAGEVPIVPPAAAVANAIYQAVGARMDRLPMSPENVLAAMRAAGDGADRRTRWLEGNDASDEAGGGAAVGVDVPEDE